MKTVTENGMPVVVYREMGMERGEGMSTAACVCVCVCVRERERWVLRDVEREMRWESN